MCVRLGSDRSNFVRVEVYDKKGRAMVFSNPIHFVREPPQTTPAGSGTLASRVVDARAEPAGAGSD